MCENMSPVKIIPDADQSAYRAVPFNQLPLDHPLCVLVELIEEARPKSRFPEYPGIADLHELLALDEVKLHYKDTGKWAKV